MKLLLLLFLQPTCSQVSGGNKEQLLSNWLAVVTHQCAGIIVVPQRLARLMDVPMLLARRQKVKRGMHWGMKYLPNVIATSVPQNHAKVAQGADEAYKNEPAWINDRWTQLIFVASDGHDYK